MKSKYFLVQHISLASGILALLALLGTQIQSVSAHNAAQPLAYVRIIHASPFVGTADVFVDGSKLLSSFQFGAVTDYVPLPSGPHKVQIALVGKGINAAALSQTLTVQAGMAYTVAALGTSPNNLSLEVFVDNNLLAPNMAKIRVYQLSPDAGAVNVNIDTDTTINNIGYQHASDYYTMDAGSHSVKLTAPAMQRSMPLAATLTANSITSVFAIGMFNGSPGAELVSTQTRGIPSLPNTGSDPTPRVEPVHAADPLVSWLLGSFAAVALGISILARKIRLGGVR
ncbi:MAG: DUF4397 domain-containing protein [Chloroflexi bacterium]|nr:DUF4397 domain-containing protein [Chloroflexota bacterium]